MILQIVGISDDEYIWILMISALIGILIKLVAIMKVRMSAAVSRPKYEDEYPPC